MKQALNVGVITLCAAMTMGHASPAAAKGDLLEYRFFGQYCFFLNASYNPVTHECSAYMVSDEGLYGNNQNTTHDAGFSFTGYSDTIDNCYIGIQGDFIESFEDDMKTEIQYCEQDNAGDQIYCHITDTNGGPGIDCK